jgi:thioredoxin reductase (NADPH)
VVGIESRGDRRAVRLANDDQICAKGVVVSTGVAFVGSGVFHGAAASESRAMQDQVVFVVGAGNSAGQAVVSLAACARTVALLVLGDSYATSMSIQTHSRVSEPVSQERPTAAPGPEGW